jgi:hypothetical protein
VARGDKIATFMCRVSGSFKLPELHGLVEASNGKALLLPLSFIHRICRQKSSLKFSAHIH